MCKKFSFLRREFINCGCCYNVQAVQNFASEYLKTPLGEPVKDKKNKTKTELWVEKFYKKTTTLPEPFPHELVERLEKYLDVSDKQTLDDFSFFLPYGLFSYTLFMCLLLYYNNRL